MQKSSYCSGPSQEPQLNMNKCWIILTVISLNFFVEGVNQSLNALTDPMTIILEMMSEMSDRIDMLEDNLKESVGPTS